MAQSNPLTRWLFPTFCCGVFLGLPLAGHSIFGQNATPAQSKTATTASNFQQWKGPKAPRKVIKMPNPGSVEYYVTVDEMLLGNGMYLVIGRPTQDFAARTKYWQVKDRRPAGGYTAAEFVVERILRQPSGSNLNANQVIVLSEPIAVIPGWALDGNPPFAVQYNLEGYHELRKGSRYIVLLYQPIPNKFILSNINLGRFNLDGTDPLDYDPMTDETGVNIKERLRSEIITRFPNVSYTPFPAPGFVFPSLTLDSIAPTQVAAGTSETVTLEIKGSGFLPFSKVRFGNTELTQLSYGDDGFLRATVPANLLANPGVYPVTIFNPATNGNNSNPVHFTVRGQSEP